MKRGYILTAVSSALLVLGGCSREPDRTVNVAGLVLNHDSLEMVRGEVTRLTAVILPQSSSGEKVVHIRRLRGCGGRERHCDSEGSG